MIRRFTQLDVFTTRATQGNPLAVVHDADGLDEAAMAAFARWTNLSETTFLLSPTDPAADYRVRIFTPLGELPFAGHPTLGSATAWLAAGGLPKKPGQLTQQCAAGLIRLRREGARLAFAAPPRVRTGPLEPELLARLRAGLGLAESEVLGHQWVDNGPGWCVIRVADAARVLSLVPDWSVLGRAKFGVLGAHPAGHDAQFEIRGFFSGFEDPVTGSLNASTAQWLMETGQVGDAYVCAQGTALGRAGRVHLSREGDTVWVGGDVAPCVSGTVTL